MKKTILKFFFSCATYAWFFLPVHHANCQSETDNSQLKYVDVLPPSPAVSNLGAFNRPDVGLIAGTAQFSVPITNISLPGFSLPVSINYSSNGVKVDEIAARVGLGWQLEAGGAITRSVQGKGPDERTILKRPPTSSTTSWDFLEYVRQISKSSGATNAPDGEYDIFNFSFAGRSGKFIMDDGDGTQNLNRVVMLDKQNLKIIKAPNFSYADYTFIIRDEQGNDFYFGGNGYKETTRRTSTCASRYNYQFEITAWFLNKVILYSGEVVSFNYNSVPMYKYDMGLSQTMNYSDPSQQSGVPCPCPQYPLYDNCISYNEVNTMALTSINARGKVIGFQYRTRLDNGDRLLEKVTVETPGFGFQETYELTYSEVNTGGYSPSGLAVLTNITHRPYLTKIERASGTTRMLYYQFEYNDPTQLPTRLSLAQDHWGYFNGKNNQWFVPKPSFQYRSQFPLAVANREVSVAHNQYGALKKITYPTGGYDLIEYETNSNWEERSVYPTAQSTLDYTLSVVSYDKDGTETLMRTFSIGFDQEVSFTLINTKGADGTPTPDDLGKVRIDRVGTGTVINTSIPSGNYPSGASLVGTAYLTAGTYKLYLTSMGDHNTTRTLFTYIPGVSTLTTKNWEIGGLRVGAIKSYSSQNDIAQVRKIKYGNSTYPDQSIAIQRFLPSYMNSTQFEYSCSKEWFPGNYACTGNPCSYGTMFSSSITNLYNPSGNAVAYPTVTESIEDINGNNIGWTEHQFNVVNDDYGTAILGSNSIGGPQSNFSLNGHGDKLRTTYGGPNGPVKIVRNFYSNHPQITEVFDAYVVNQHFDNICVYGPGIPGDSPAGLNPYEATRYSLMSLKTVLDSTVEETYDPNTVGSLLKTYQKFIYTDTSSLKPTLVRTTDSEGRTVKTYNYYPRTAAGLITGQGTFLTNLADKNVDNLVLQKNTTNDAYTGGYEVEHANSGKVYPSKVKSYVQEGLEANSFTIISRDTYSNTIERMNDSGVRECYIWDYGQTLPIAKVVNANLTGVAYTSFETSALGNWSSPISGTTVDDFTAPSGLKCLALSSGSIFKSGLDASLKYRLLVWVKSGSSITVSSGGSIIDQTAVVSRSGWTLNNYLLSTSGVIQISGSGSIDEIRLHPQDAQMISNTYEPLIGPTANFDANGIPTYYEYDIFKRLKAVYDVKGNLLKAHQYNYMVPGN